MATTMYVVWYSRSGRVQHRSAYSAPVAHRIAVGLRADGYDVRVEVAS
jgi:hypothetical protein